MKKLLIILLFPFMCYSQDSLKLALRHYEVQNNARFLGVTYLMGSLVLVKINNYDIDRTNVGYHNKFNKYCISFGVSAFMIHNTVAYISKKRKDKYLKYKWSLELD